MNYVLVEKVDDGRRKIPCKICLSCDAYEIGRKRHIGLSRFPQMSRKHAIVWRSGSGSLFLKDLQSKNGTFVNSVKIINNLQLLKAGDVINFGGLRAPSVATFILCVENLEPKAIHLNESDASKSVTKGDCNKQLLTNGHEFLNEINFSVNSVFNINNGFLLNGDYISNINCPSKIEPSTSSSCPNTLSNINAFPQKSQHHSQNMLNKRKLLQQPEYDTFNKTRWKRIRRRISDISDNTDDELPPVLSLINKNKEEASAVGPCLQTEKIMTTCDDSNLDFNSPQNSGERGLKNELNNCVLNVIGDEVTNDNQFESIENTKKHVCGGFTERQSNIEQTNNAAAQDEILILNCKEKCTINYEPTIDLVLECEESDANEDEINEVLTSESDTNNDTFVIDKNNSFYSVSKDKKIAKSIRRTVLTEAKPLPQRLHKMRGKNGFTKNRNYFKAQCLKSKIGAGNRFEVSKTLINTKKSNLKRFKIPLKSNFQNHISISENKVKCSSTKNISNKDHPNYLYNTSNKTPRVKERDGNLLGVPQSCNKDTELRKDKLTTARPAVFHNLRENIINVKDHNNIQCFMPGASSQISRIHDKSNIHIKQSNLKTSEVQLKKDEGFAKTQHNFDPTSNSCFCRPNECQKDTHIIPQDSSKRILNTLNHEVLTSESESNNDTSIIDKINSSCGFTERQSNIEQTNNAAAQDEILILNCKEKCKINEPTLDLVLECEESDANEDEINEVLTSESDANNDTSVIDKNNSFYSVSRDKKIAKSIRRTVLTEAKPLLQRLHKIRGGTGFTKNRNYFKAQCLKSKIGAGNRFEVCKTLIHTKKSNLKRFNTPLKSNFQNHISISENEVKCGNIKNISNKDHPNYLYNTLIKTPRAKERDGNLLGLPQSCNKDTELRKVKLTTARPAVFNNLRENIINVKDHNNIQCFMPGASSQISRIHDKSNIHIKQSNLKTSEIQFKIDEDFAKKHLNFDLTSNSFFINPKESRKETNIIPQDSSKRILNTLNHEVLTSESESNNDTFVIDKTNSFYSASRDKKIAKYIRRTMLTEAKSLPQRFHKMRGINGINKYGSSKNISNKDHPNYLYNTLNKTPSAKERDGNFLGLPQSCNKDTELKKDKLTTDGSAVFHNLKETIINAKHQNNIKCLTSAASSQISRIHDKSNMHIKESNLKTSEIQFKMDEVFAKNYLNFDLTSNSFFCNPKQSRKETNIISQDSSKRKLTALNPIHSLQSGTKFINSKNINNFKKPICHESSTNSLKHMGYNFSEVSSLKLIKAILTISPEFLKIPVMLENPPPQILEGADHLPLYFKSYRNYVSLFLPMIMVEIWKYIFTEYKKVFESMNSVNEFNFSLLSFKSKIDCIEMKCQSIVEEKSLYYPCKGSLVIMNITDNCNQLHTVFGYIFRHETKELNINSFKKSTLKLLPNAGMTDAKHCTYYVYIKKELVPKKGWMMKGYEICCLRNKLWQLDALDEIKFSPLLDNILQPNLRSFMIHCSGSSSSMKLHTDIQNQVAGICTEIMNPSSKPKILLVQGPPGTGKTSTIVNILEKLVPDGRSKILVVAPTNSAIDEIGCRLLNINKKHGLRPINFVRIGPETLVCQEMLPYLLDNKAKELHEQDIKRDILNLTKKINKFHKKYTHATNEDLKNWRTHRECLRNYLNTGTENLNKKHCLESSLNFVRIGSISQELHEQCMENRSKSLQEEIENLTAKITRFDKVTAKYATNKELKRWRDQRGYLINDMYFKEKVLHNCDIVLSTINSILNPRFRLLQIFNSNSNSCFSSCIIDDSTHCTEMEVLQPLIFGMNKLILFGDQTQFPVTVHSQLTRALGFERSMFERFNLFLEAKTGQSQVYSLTKQYRMHSNICEFPSKYLYSRRLFADPCVDKSYGAFPLKPYIILDIKNYLNSNEVNYTEISVISSLCKCLLNVTNPSPSIGIIPICAEGQNLYNTELHKDPCFNDIEINTVDSFRGREKDVIILTCINSLLDGEDSDINRNQFNVSLTRAKKCLIICCQNNVLRQYPDWSALLDDAIQREICYIVPSPERIPLMFEDCMKKSYSWPVKYF